MIDIDQTIARLAIECGAPIYDYLKWCELLRQKPEVQREMLRLICASRHIEPVTTNNHTNEAAN